MAHKSKNLCASISFFAYKSSVTSFGIYINDTISSSVALCTDIIGFSEVFILTPGTRLSMGRGGGTSSSQFAKIAKFSYFLQPLPHATSAKSAAAFLYPRAATV